MLIYTYFWTEWTDIFFREPLITLWETQAENIQFFFKSDFKNSTFSEFLNIFSLTLWMMHRASKSVYLEQDQSLGYIGMIMVGHLFQEELPKPWMEG